MSVELDVWLLDLASIRFSWSPGSSCLSVFSSRLEVLAVVKLDPTLPVEELATRGFNEVLERGKITRVLDTGGRSTFRVALYNPYTAEVAVGGLPRTKAFSDREALQISDEGCPGAVRGNQLWLAGRKLEYVPVSPAHIIHAKAAHEELAAVC